MKASNPNWPPVNTEWTDREIYFRYMKGDPKKIVKILSELTLLSEMDIIRAVESQGGEVLESVKNKARKKEEKLKCTAGKRSKQ